MMEPLEKKWMPRATQTSRRQEIERCLAQFGLTRGADHLLGRTRRAGYEETHSRRLCEALESLGPVFSSFGIYMSSRVDLLPVEVCLDLAMIADRAEATPIRTVHELIDREFACSYEEEYAVFEESPFESRLTFQSHHAWLKNGEAVTVKVFHPEFEEQVTRDVKLLPLLKGAFTGEAQINLPIEKAIDDFQHALYWQMNLLHEVKAFDDLTRDAEDFEMLRVPIVHKHLCSSRVSTIEHVPGVNFEDIKVSFDENELGAHAPIGGAPGSMGLALNDCARRLCIVWLRQALLGSRFPVELHSGNIAVLANKQIVFTGGESTKLPSDAKKNLWNYLVATSAEDPDRACSYLLREMVKEGRSLNEDELRHRFREIVPFRDGGWSRNGESSSLAEHLFIHWKLASERGLRPHFHLLCFYRGLFQTAALARRLAPRCDPLLEGLQDVRTMAMLAEVREMMGLQQFRENLDKYTSMMMELPQRLDEVLTLVTENSTRLKLQAMRGAGYRGQKNSSAVVFALLFVLAAVVLVSHHLAVSEVTGVWGDRISAVVFVLIGALLLRAVTGPH
jgi:ubiquinone biosynthesis protein